MKNKALYYLCKGLNWTHWFIIAGLCEVLEMFSDETNHLIEYAGIIFGSTFIYVIFWFLFSNTRSRWLYQIWFFLGYLGAEYYMFFSPEGGIFGWLSYDIRANIIQKIILTLACIVAFAHKLYTMSYEKDDYKSGASRRHNNRLDEKVYSATYKVERATTFREKQQAEAELERAKYNRDKNSWDED